MSFELWAAFALASAILVPIPGPTVTLVVAYALGAGRSAALFVALGVFLGDLVAITASALGLGAVLAASATAFDFLKWIGGAYLIFLGWRLWTAPASAERIEALRARAGGVRMCLHAFLVTATNPKGLVFFVAFLPQFLDPAAAPAPQLATMVATFTLIGAANALACALAAGTLRERLTRPALLKWLNRGGGALVEMGALTLGASRA